MKVLNACCYKYVGWTSRIILNVGLVMRHQRVLESEGEGKAQWDYREGARNEKTKMTATEVKKKNYREEK